jgi:hypothetical protein
MHRYAVASRRARLLAEVFRTRSITLEHRETIMMVVLHLETAAARLHQYPAPVTSEPTGIPLNLRDDVDALLQLQAAIPHLVPAEIFGYVTAPLTGEAVAVAPLDPSSGKLIDAERRTRDSIANLTRRHLDSRHDDVVRAALDGLLSLHNRRHRIAEAMGSDADRPDGRTVHVRIGAYRTAYHPNPACPALTGKPATFSGQESMTERQAHAEGLRECRRCPSA